MEAVARSAAPASSPRERAETREQLKRVRRALRTIPGAKRAVFVMFEIEGRTCEEIAVALRIPVGTVYSRLHSARMHFAQNYTSPATERPLALSDSLSFVSLGA
jgi:RNA polymerase sigma-70 factor (ECF subfamily)